MSVTFILEMRSSLEKPALFDSTVGSVKSHLNDDALGHQLCRRSRVLTLCTTDLVSCRRDSYVDRFCGISATWFHAATIAMLVVSVEPLGPGFRKTRY